MESTSRWGAFFRSVTPDRRPGDYQHAACRILNGIAKRIETTLQALPPGTPGKAQALAALQAFKQALKDETSGTPLRAHSTFFAEKWRNIFQFSSIPTEYRHGPYKRRLKNCFKGWSLVRPSVSLRHMHHCMSMNALEQGLLGLEAAKASDIDDFV